MKLSKIIFGFIVSATILGGFTTAQVNAQAANSSAAQGIEISPALVELNAARGKTYNIKLKVRNVTDSDLVYTASVVDFGSADETGSPSIILDSKLPETSSIVSWIVSIPQFTLSAQELRVIEAQIVIPDNAEPGGHYGVLRFSGTAPDLDSSGVGLSASAGSLILVRVDGDISEKASLASFFAAQNDKQSSVFENGPISLVTRIKNDGNIHVKPVGSVELKDMFGNIVQTIPVNDEKSNVLPDSIRRFESKYDGSWMIGLYTANLTLGYGTTGQAITNTITFWVIPYKIILAGLIILAALFFTLKNLIRGYNKRIIEKHKHEYSSKNKNSSKKG